MRIALALLLLMGMLAMSADDGRVSAAQPVNQNETRGEEINMGTETDLLKWSVTQGALTLVLVLVLISYRRDFFRKVALKEEEISTLREDKRALVAVLDKSADANLRQVVATVANTEATKLLAQNVNNLAERRSHQRD